MAASRTSAKALFAGLAAVFVLVTSSPLLMAMLSDTALPWDRLADVGDAFGGASALLSAVALCGIGASLIFQQRQIRQELADIDRQQHLELLKLAIDNPELIEVLNGEPAGAHTRQEIYANLAMMYWLAIWELGEIDDDELRAMAATMFRGAVTRRWWSRVGKGWIGTRRRPDRARFVSIITAEMRAADVAAARSAGGRRRAKGLLLTAVAVGLAVGADRYLGARRRIRPARMSSMNPRQASRS